MSKNGERQFKGYLLLITLAVLWGVAWPTMKMVLNEMPIWTFRTICLSVGGILLLGLTAMTGRRITLATAEYLPVLVCSIFNVIGWQVFSAYGLNLMDAGRSSIVAFTMPVWATLFSVVVLSEKFTLRKGLALLLGMSGLYILIGSDELAQRAMPLGALFMIAAAMSWAFGSVLVKKFTWESSIGTVMGWQLLVGAIPITITAAFLEPFPAIPSLSTSALLAFVYVLIFPMAYCQWAYFKAVQVLGPSNASMGTLLIPVVGVISSAYLLSEDVGTTEVVALAFVCSAIAAVILPVKPRQPGSAT